MPLRGLFNVTMDNQCDILFTPFECIRSEQVLVKWHVILLPHVRNVGKKLQSYILHAKLSFKDSLVQ